MARFAAVVVLALPLALAGCAGTAGRNAAAPAATATPVSSAPTVFDLQRQINSLQTQIDLMREQIRELQTGQTGKTL
ncbi:MAG: hypothetical protein MI785_21415 [Kiloniellales bacterium]|nr:hypothetical protein [Kiloniellales bacterium]